MDVLLLLLLEVNDGSSNIPNLLALLLNDPKKLKGLVNVLPPSPPQTTNSSSTRNFLEKCTTFIQAVVYGLGVCAEFGGSIFKPLVGVMQFSIILLLYFLMLQIIGIKIKVPSSGTFHFM